MLTEKGVPGECVLIIGPRHQERRAAKVVQPGADTDHLAQECDDTSEGQPAGPRVPEASRGSPPAIGRVPARLQPTVLNGLHRLRQLASEACGLADGWRRCALGRAHLGLHACAAELELEEDIQLAWHQAGHCRVECSA